jgi:hypothetical protein
MLKFLSALLKPFSPSHPHPDKLMRPPMPQPERDIPGILVEDLRTSAVAWVTKFTGPTDNPDLAQTMSDCIVSQLDHYRHKDGPHEMVIVTVRIPDGPPGSMAVRYVRMERFKYVPNDGYR